ncbi:zinc finger protein weckle-like isoform X2 [Anopheles funestus]|uniref:zinc finger protein weckle-like isoform X2 n=1 Tax=Anopheles funestus TaxID=62324 RepID=UPI0020C701F0|nr:zinc finger protein weckle-like isoform X2 [Anopheles funestus]
MLTSWKTWCRLCANEKAVLKLESVHDINAVISTMLDVSILEIKDVPPNICEECLSFVNKLEHFKEKCNQTNRLFDYLSKYSPMGVQKFDMQQIRSTFLGKQEMENVASQLCEVLDMESKHFLNIDPEHVAQHIEEIEKVEDGNAEDFYQVESLAIASAQSEFENNENTEQWEMLEVEMDDYSNQMEANDENIEDVFDKESDSRQSEVVNRTPKRTSRRQQSIQLADNSANDESLSSNTRHNTRQSANKTASIPQAFQCKICLKTFNSSTYLRRHEVIHLPQDEKHRYSCTICHKMFNKSFNLKAHMRMTHEGVKPFICEECGKTFSSKGALKEHYIVHTEERPFQCAYCSKQFKNAARLKTHEDTHNDTLYVCPHCGLKLNTKRTLNMHMVVHSDQKKFKCQECGNEYKRSKALKAHLILHTGLRPYQCPFCDKTFANGSNCRSHKKKFHPRELAALEAAGGHKPTANIPKLEHLQRSQSDGETVEITRKHIRSSIRSPNGNKLKPSLQDVSTDEDDQMPEGDLLGS